MAIGDLSIGDFAIGDGIGVVSVNIAVPVSVISLSTSSPIIAQIQVGAIADVPLSSISLEHPSPIPVSGASIATPVSMIAFVPRVPELNVGKLVDAPVLSASVVAKIPAVQAGSKVDAPISTVSLTALAPQFVHSANIFILDTPAVAAATMTPLISGGAYVAVDSFSSIVASGSIGDDAIGDHSIGSGKNFTATTLGAPRIYAIASAPVVQAGIAVDVSASLVSISAPAPQILHSVNILVPTSQPLLVAPPPTVAGGSTIDISSFRSVAAGGSIGDGAIGDHSIGSGENAATETFGVPRFYVTAPKPAIQAGAAISIPVGGVSLAAQVAEVYSRRRRVGLHVINS